MKPQKKNFTTEHTEKKIFKFKNSVNSVVSFDNTGILQRGKPMKTMLLLVDDEESFVDILAERLRNRDFDVNTALNGEDALQKIKEHNVDVAIVDVMMPGLSGIETLREIKRLKPLVEVLMLTGHATVETAIEGMKLGAYDYLMKPCDMDQLLAKIGEAKDKKNKHEEKIREAKIKELSSRFV